MKTLFTFIISLLCLTGFGQVNTSVTNGLVGWWMPYGTNLSGATVTDFSGYGNNGVSTNSPYWTNSVTGNTNSIYFNGTSQSVILGTASTFNLTGNLTLSVWFRVNSLSVMSQWFLGKDDATLGRSYDFGFYYTNLIFQVNGVNQGASQAFTADGNWHNATVVLNGANVSYFYDATNCGTSGGCPAINVSTSLLFIGQRSFTTYPDYFGGSLADVHIYNRPLSTNEITTLYHEGQPWHMLSIGQPLNKYQRISR